MTDTTDTQDMTIDELREYVASLELIARFHDDLMAVLPECPTHGRGCIPYVKEWVETMRTRDLPEDAKTSEIMMLREFLKTIQHASDNMKQHYKRV